eukprot:Opistho-2@91962
MMDRVPKMSAHHRKLYQSLSVNFTIGFDLAALKSTVRESTLAEALKMSIAQIREILNTNITGLSVGSNLFLLPLLNGLDVSSLSKTMNASAEYTRTEVDDSIDNMGRESLAMSVAGLVVVVVLSLFVVLPTIVYVERTSENTLRVFENVPRDTIRKMRSRCEKKVKELQEEDNSASDSEEDGGSDAERNGRRRAPKVDVAQRTMVFTRSWKYIATIALKISAVFVIGVVFFSLTYNFGFVSIEKNLREGAIRVEYATYIRTSVRSLLWSTYDTSSGLSQGSVLANIVKTARYEISEMNRGLEIGSSVFGIPPQSSLSNIHNNLLYDDACAVLDVVVADPSLLKECESVGT